MNIPVVEHGMSQRLAIVDCGIHPAQPSPRHLLRFLSQRWRDHLSRDPQMRRAAAQDAAPTHTSDLDTLRRQHLDPNAIELGMLVALSWDGPDARNPDLAAALSAAVNEWQREEWVHKEPRLRGGIVVPHGDAAFAASEIERHCDDRTFVQVVITPRAGDLLGQRRYWPIYEAAECCGLPIGLHPSAQADDREHEGMQRILMSLVFEGVFERFPTLKVALIESGFAWVPNLCAGMDEHWERVRKEMPQLKRPPSDYVREHVWFAARPARQAGLPAVIEQLGNRLLFASNYPHGDPDDGNDTFELTLNDAQRAQALCDNAKALYRLQ
jgi:uncharacterized protein